MVEQRAYLNETPPVEASNRKTRTGPWTVQVRKKKKILRQQSTSMHTGTSKTRMGRAPPVRRGDRERFPKSFHDDESKVFSKKKKLDSLVVSLHLANTQISYAHAHTPAIALSDTLSLC